MTEAPGDRGERVGLRVAAVPVEQPLAGAERVRDSAASPRRRIDQQSGTGSQRYSSSVRPARRSRLIPTELSCWSSSRPTRSVRISMAGTLAAGCDILGSWPATRRRLPRVGRARSRDGPGRARRPRHRRVLGQLRLAVRGRAGGRIPRRRAGGRRGATGGAMTDAAVTGEQRPATRWPRPRSATPSATRSPRTATRPPPVSRETRPEPGRRPRPGPVPPRRPADRRPVGRRHGTERPPTSRRRPGRRTRRATAPPPPDSRPAPRRTAGSAGRTAPAGPAAGSSGNSTGSAGAPPAGPGGRRQQQLHQLRPGPDAAGRTGSAPAASAQARRRTGPARRRAPAACVGQRTGAGGAQGRRGRAAGGAGVRTVVRPATAGRPRSGAARVRVWTPRGGQPDRPTDRHGAVAGGSGGSGWDDFFAGTGGTSGGSGKQPSGAEVARALLEAFRRSLRDR